MGPLYAYSLIPVLAVSLLLFFTASLRGKNTRGLAAYCLSVAVWCGTLLLVASPSTQQIGRRLVAIGAFIAAGYLHAAYDVTEQKSYRLVAFAYAVALVITALASTQPGVVYDPITLEEGPLFWPTMALAIVANAVPLVQIWRAEQGKDPVRGPMLRRLFVAGLLCDLGGMGNALLLSHGSALPFGMLLVLASLLVLGRVVRDHEPPAERRILDRSLLYSAIAAFLSAGFMLGVLSLSGGAEPLLAEYRVGALFLLTMAFLAFEPIRQHVGEALGRRLVTGTTSAKDLALALEREEEKAERAERLAELGTLVSAVAHEVRNPLGVLSAHLKTLERSGGVEPETLAAMKEQIERASRFTDDLLRYGRPRPLELRTVDVAAIADLALSTAKSGLGAAAPAGVELRREVASETTTIEADQAQLVQVLVILFENALLAFEGRDPKILRVAIGELAERVSIAIEDSGPGIPDEIAPRLFQPFVTGRKRGGPRPGTGLGLATARRIVERHQGRITAGRSDLGGARFSIEVPRRQEIGRPT